jgi:Na+-transporting methylmalonyl-CoA/oxaloacetate decarboxylase gamma subunit
MDAVLTTLGTFMLVLVGVAVVLALLILVLYEAGWVIRLGARLREDRRLVGIDRLHDEGSRTWVDHPQSSEDRGNS